jgi:glycosidase
MECHISRRSREKYNFDLELFSLKGNILFANFHAARLFAQAINNKKDLVTYPEQAIQAGQINALGLIDEIFHLIFHQYLDDTDPKLLSTLFTFLETKLGSEDLQKILLTFDMYFPNTRDFKKNNNEIELRLKSGDTEVQQDLIEEILILWITNQNPAVMPYSELFDDSDLSKSTDYSKAMLYINEFFKGKPHFGPDNQDIVTMLRTPSIEVPYSLSGQLEFIRVRWGHLIGNYLYRLLGSLDLIKEEQKLYFVGDASSLPTSLPELSTYGFEYERFSPDSEWMPNVVMLAKNTYVWLSQLSKAYGREIKYLSQIPDEALDMLANWGFTGLWLIGLWERSESSKKIKQLCGNPDAVASAYSLTRYQIAEDLGGELAYKNLQERTAKRGIRLASDMVPNHMGIDSDWVYDHPDWFVQLDHSPFPSYSFNGIDLSKKSNVSVNLEDHYYDRTDASVVFKLYDHTTRRERFIYHGNDGTSMPWNDTAQLNYLLPEVREAVIQTILSVARRFPIIRFDAAMTLAKKHYQRLWFPQPGTGGDIPTRSEFGMTKEEFDKAIPEEFWREVVDRVAKEVPDTLLLAEAFWLMEGFFVRTLGMHRVYNSAFMHMLRNEENQKYRRLISSTLEFDPQILKRYVNFMNNPDEKTSVEQFGKGDKYFGICTLLVTMPGLPMVGHGQIEGYSEKYGMEYYRAYWDEVPDENLVKRHEREIFPLIKKRYLFADVENFALYNFYTNNGSIDENVFAYSNGKGSERSLVIVNNRFGNTQGSIKQSTEIKVKDSDPKSLDVYHGLNLGGLHDVYVIFRDAHTGLEFIRPSQSIKDNGLYFNLEAYDYHVFLDFREVQDDGTRQFQRLDQYLNGRGIPSIQSALQELTLAPVLDPIRNLVNAQNLKVLISYISDEPTNLDNSRSITYIIDLYEKMIQALQDHRQIVFDRPQIENHLKNGLDLLRSLVDKQDKLEVNKLLKFSTAYDYLTAGFKHNKKNYFTLILWLLLHNLGGYVQGNTSGEYSRSLIEEWNLTNYLESILMDCGLSMGDAQKAVQAVKIIISNQDWAVDIIHQRPHNILENWLSDNYVRSYIGINRYKDVLWFNKESFDSMVWHMFAVCWCLSATDTEKSITSHIQDMILTFENIKKIIKAELKSEFQLTKLMDNLK